MSHQPALDRTDMDLSESHTHSFVIKIWLEETAEETGNAIWRGHITHVPSQRRVYFMRLTEISFFILLYLKAMGVSPSWYWKIQQWLKRRKEIKVK